MQPLTIDQYKAICKEDQIKIGQDLDDLADQYEGNLLNYFCGMSPDESRRFNKMLN